ncbi:sensor domain-containing phosphodiesterase [Paludibacterium purpuratum]|uniref:EAL domain-containing protein (Putative c-di-GMP-specific phosphodiesterase class I) n=1 Tax=Paludibacterium purpuratum TaxID=1144873 RepID=A0A4R7B0J8_9NEIS|nr:EAL domain-containing protein [Paludibacterium purpuratum]TDR76436.1 EAL domain-containing protein (putative c-di-GMP-specific phosphodiesterase class I) [Paludibacterium purpuratum]
MDAKHSTVDETIMDTLHSVRTLLGMQIAFISEFKDGRRIFRFVDSAEDLPPLVCVGNSDPLEESYCQRVVDGRLPELIRDARQNAEAMTLPVTAALPVGAHLSVPIRFSDGHVYGTFCCFSLAPDATLNERDIRTLRLFAEMTCKLMEQQIEQSHSHQLIVDRLQDTLDAERFNIVYQPIIHIAQHRIVGYEALSRFSAEPIRSPDIWFNEAAEVGLQEALELATIRKALQGLIRFPDDTYMSLNASPATILKGSLDALLADYPLDRLMLEVTEHTSVDDYAQIVTALKPLRDRGLRLAVDDAGAGYASFRHILKLQPDIIKLDVSLIRQIDCDTGCRALAGALIRFAEETGSKIVAEGVETVEELKVLRALKVNKAQGYLLGRPTTIDALPSEPAWGDGFPALGGSNSA